MKDKILGYVREPQFWGFFLSMAVLAVIALAFFAPDNVEGNSLMQHDMQQGIANSHEGQLYEQETGDKALWTNALFSGMPTFQISPSYPSNSLFDWINTVYGLGLPAPSNLLFMMMFGFLILLYCMRVRWYYALVGAIAWGFSSYFIIIIGAGHIWKFLALTYIPPTIGGLTLCYRGRYALGGGLTALFAMLQLNANHPQMTYYFAFVMLALSLAYLLMSIRERRAKQWCLGTGALLMAGLLAFGANLPSLYNTYEYAKETKRAQSELTQSTDRQGIKDRPTGGLPKGDIVNWSYGPSEMFTLLIPNVKGGASAKPVAGQMHGVTLDQLDNAKDVPVSVEPFLPFFTQYFNEGEGTNGPVYVGAVIFALFLIGCVVVRGPVKWALVAMTVISMLLALGRNFEGLTDFMIYNFPMYSKFRAVESILVIAEFTIPLLATLAVVKLLGSGREDSALDLGRPLLPYRLTAKGVSITIICCFGACLLVCLIGLVFPEVFGSTVTANDTNIINQIQQAYPDYQFPTQIIYQHIADLRYDMVRSDCLRAILFLVLGFVTLYFTWMARRKEGSSASLSLVGSLCLAALVLVDLYTVDKRYIDHDSFVQPDPYAPRQDYDPFAPDDIDKCILQDTTLSYRVMDIPGFGSPTRSYHHKMVGGYHAAKLNRYEDLIQRRMAHVLGIGYMPELRDDSIAALYADQQDVVSELRADYRVLDMLNARYVITGDAQYPLESNPNALGNAWLVGDIRYVDDANAEMEALGKLDPATQAVADRRFMQALGQDFVAPQPGDFIALTDYTPNKLTYSARTTADAVGVFSEVYFPWGWRATIDGQEAPLARVNYILRALRIPAGSHTIEMTFDPASIRSTTTVAFVCVILVYLWLIAGCAAALRRGSAKDRR